MSEIGAKEPCEASMGPVAVCYEECLAIIPAMESIGVRKLSRDVNMWLSTLDRAISIDALFGDLALV